jgi:hypothetical protein
VGRPGLDPDLHPERRRKIQRGELAHGRLECQGRGHAAAAIVGVEPGHEAVAAEVQHAAAETVDLSDQAVVDAVQGDDELLGAAAQTEAADQRVGEPGEPGDVREQGTASALGRKLRPRCEGVPAIHRDEGSEFLGQLGHFTRRCPVRAASQASMPR